MFKSRSFNHETAQKPQRKNNVFSRGVGREPPSCWAGSGYIWINIIYYRSLIYKLNYSLILGEMLSEL